MTTTSGNPSGGGIGIPIEQAVRALHPPRVGRLSSAASQSNTQTTTTTTGVGSNSNSNSRTQARSSLHNLDVSSHHVSAEGGTAGGGASSTVGAGGGGGAGGSCRFSQLLLEHGERHLQDWAVLAASSPRHLPPALLHHQASAAGANGTRRRKGSGKKPKRKSKRPGAGGGAGGDGNERIPSIGMVAVPGRLRLCSRSVVFEPDDVSRGIVRCPFSRMAGRPRAAMVGDQARAVTYVCGRHSVMRANAVVGPHDTVDEGAEFRFTFRHSSPAQFLDLIRTMAGDDAADGNVNGNGGHGAGAGFVPSPAAIDRILQPMLDLPFDPHNLLDIREVPRTSNLRCHQLSPLQAQPGCSIVTDRHVYFQPASSVMSGVAEPAKAFAIRDVVATARRYHGLRDCAVELYLSSGASVLLAYETKRERERVLSLLPRLQDGVPCHTDPSFIVAAQEGWKAGKISNFDYLLALNSAAGRTFHDLSRYPVFPWVVADYTSEKLDLNNPGTFRDLTKPVGALNKERLEYFMSRYKSMQGDMDHAFLYGTHYSAPGYVLYYLVRSMPDQMLCLQNGKFDAADRMFHDVDHTYASILINHADVKELIPEFYDPEAGYDFLINARSLQLGSTQTGERVHDVKLPKWAKDPREFLEKNRRALECDVVTKLLPRWVDLVFGQKSRGQGAKDALNLFHPTSYIQSSDFEAMKTDEDKMQAELQATEFGICPDLLFIRTHPLKSDISVPSNILSPALSGRAMTLEQLGDDFGTDYSKAESGDQPWELLETPAGQAPAPNDNYGSNAFMPNESEHGTAPKSGTNEATRPTQASNPFGDEEDDEAEDEEDSAMGLTKSLSLKGSGRGTQSSHFTTDSDIYRESKPSAPTSRTQEVVVNDLPSNHDGWKRKALLCKQIHSDTVSGCSLLVQEDRRQPSYLVSVSLDGRLLVHTLPFLQEDQDQRRNFSSTSAITRLSYLGLGSDKSEGQYSLKELRTHSSTDPLACLALTSDGGGGRIAFAGGHDDVVFAYGLNSACALASVYSHRDAVTGIDLIERSSFDNNAVFGDAAASSMKSTHIMVTGSYDATVKVWAVTVAAGETVAIDRNPIAELFDADASIASVAVTEIYGSGVAIAAGCSDGSLIVWVCTKNGGKKVLYKEEARRGGSCAAVKWAPGNYLFAAFGNRVASYLLSNGTLRPVSKISAGSPVNCLTLIEENLFAGCADGGLRMIPIAEGAHFNTSPQPWRGINGEQSPALTSISGSKLQRSESGQRRYLIATGSVDGNMAVFELEETTR